MTTRCFLQLTSISKSINCIWNKVQFKFHLISNENHLHLCTSWIGNIELYTTCNSLYGDILKITLALIWPLMCNISDYLICVCFCLILFIELQYFVLLLRSVMEVQQTHSWLVSSVVKRCPTPSSHNPTSCTYASKVTSLLPEMDLMPHGHLLHMVRTQFTETNLLLCSLKDFNPQLS